jgi:Zn-dependent oligopeptidase
MSNPSKAIDFKFMYSVVDDNTTKLEDFYVKFKEKLSNARGAIQELENETDYNKEEDLIFILAKLEDELNDIINDTWM